MKKLSKIYFEHRRASSIDDKIFDKTKYCFAKMFDSIEIENNEIATTIQRNDKKRYEFERE